MLSFLEIGFEDVWFFDLVEDLFAFLAILSTYN